ncbi:MAG: glycoside hydrolase family protein [bacterium]
MKNYFVWGGSVVKADSKYHMFASRWPENTGFPEGYFNNSEIVRAEADTPSGPYHFKEIVISKRKGNYWDSLMAHNPYLVQFENKYILYYIGKKDADSDRKIGYAVADNIKGPWDRIDQPIKLTSDANNPAPFIETDGSVKLVFRDKKLRMGIATADRFDSNYSISSFDLFPGIRLEDPCIYYQNGIYHIICEDNQGKISGHTRWGVHLVSESGITNWKKGDPLIAYNHTITRENGEKFTFDRRERPQLIFDEKGNITHLITAVLSGGNTWCLVEPIKKH